MRSVADAVVEGAAPSGRTPPAATARVRPEDPAHLALREYGTEHARAFLAAGGRAGGGPEAVRQMRTAASRLRDMLRVFEPMLEPEWAGGLGAELRWIGAVLAGEGDRQMVLDRLCRDLDQLGEDDGTRRARHLLSRRLSREVAVLHAEALVALGSPRYRSLADRLTVLGDDLRATDAGGLPCREALPPPVTAAYRRVSTAVEGLGPAEPDEVWHRARALARRSRYAVEFCVPVFGQQARAFCRQLERATEILGRHQDAVTAAHEARAAAVTARIAPSTSFALGVLHATERAAVATARRDLAETWPEVDGKRWRRWLTRT